MHSAAITFGLLLAPAVAIATPSECYEYFGDGKGHMVCISTAYNASGTASIGDKAEYYNDTQGQIGPAVDGEYLASAPGVTPPRIYRVEKGMATLLEGDRD